MITPLYEYSVLGRTIFVKDETKQDGGSFKIRGPKQFLSHYPSAKRVVTASSGNHGIGVCMAAMSCGVRAIVFLPKATPLQKIEKIQAAGGDVRFVGGGYEQALLAAKAYAETSGELLLPSYDHQLIIDGNRELFTEAFEQMACQVDAVCVPVGGGGCVSAAIEVCSGKNIDVVAAEYAPFFRIDRLALRSEADFIQTDYIGEPSTEGISIKTLGHLNKQIIRGCERLLPVQVSYDELVTACRCLYDTFGIVAELGACAGFAAAVSSMDAYDNLLCVVTGGNIDPQLHQSIVRKRN